MGPLNLSSISLTRMLINGFSVWSQTLKREIIMNKKELVAAVATSCGTTQTEAGNVINAFCDTVIGQLKDGNGLSLIHI